MEAAALALRAACEKKDWKVALQLLEDLLWVRLALGFRGLGVIGFRGYRGYRGCRV